MGFPNHAASVFDVLMALFQSPLWVVVMTKSMRHSGVTLRGNIITSRFEQLAVLVRLISAEVKLRSDDVCPRHAFERLCEDGRGHPVFQRRLAQLCRDASAAIVIYHSCHGLLTCVFRYPVVHEPIHTRSWTPGVMLHHRNTWVFLHHFGL